MHTPLTHARSSARRLLQGGRRRQRQVWRGVVRDLCAAASCQGPTEAQAAPPAAGRMYRLQHRGRLGRRPHILLLAPVRIRRRTPPPRFPARLCVDFAPPRLLRVFALISYAPCAVCAANATCSCPRRRCSPTGARRRAARCAGARAQRPRGGTRRRAPRCWRARSRCARKPGPDAMRGLCYGVARATPRGAEARGAYMMCKQPVALSAPETAHI